MLGTFSRSNVNVNYTEKAHFASKTKAKKVNLSVSCIFKTAYLRHRTIACSNNRQLIINAIWKGKQRKKSDAWNLGRFRNKAWKWKIHIKPSAFTLDFLNHWWPTDCKLLFLRAFFSSSCFLENDKRKKEVLDCVYCCIAYRFIFVWASIAESLLRCFYQINVIIGFRLSCSFTVTENCAKLEQYSGEWTNVIKYLW